MHFLYKVKTIYIPHIGKVQIHYKESKYIYQYTKACQSAKQACINVLGCNHINAQIPNGEFELSTQSLIKKYMAS